MPDVCTCGAHLPPDALFCHKCGKPQREDLLPEVEPSPPPLLRPIAPPPPPPIGFQNGPAVRIALLAGTLAFACSVLSGQLALPQIFALLWLVAAGFFAVFLYERRTGQALSVLSGARLGWICGVFGFVIVTVVLAVTAVALSDPTAVSTMRDQLKTHGIPEANVNQMIQMFQTPTGILGAVLASFLLFTVLPAFGGAVGARFLRKD